MRLSKVIQPVWALMCMTTRKSWQVFIAQHTFSWRMAHFMTSTVQKFFSPVPGPRYIKATSQLVSQCVPCYNNLSTLSHVFGRTSAAPNSRITFELVESRWLERTSVLTLPYQLSEINCYKELSINLIKLFNLHY